MRDQLDRELLQQPFDSTATSEEQFSTAKQVAETYARIENSIAVLSDLRASRSVIYYGGSADLLGWNGRSSEAIGSIWEEEIFERIHPDDLDEKHRAELYFFHFLRQTAPCRRADYRTQSTLRMRDSAGVYRAVLHRMFYLANADDGGLWLAMCLYNIAECGGEQSAHAAIVNTRTGEVLTPDFAVGESLLTRRECEVLRLIGRGLSSRQIADSLSISLHTVSRHRQNILEKLRVRNSVEACRFADRMGWL